MTLAAVHKASRACEAIVGAIARTPCCVAPQPAASGQMLSLQEACAIIEAQHQEVVRPPINELSPIKRNPLLSKSMTLDVLKSYALCTATCLRSFWLGQNAESMPLKQGFSWELLPAQAIAELVQKYRSMSELLRKVEEAVMGSVSGRAPGLAQYYAHWERAVFLALNAVTLGSMTSLLRMLRAPAVPLFEVCDQGLGADL